MGDYTWQNYSEVSDRVDHVGAGLLGIGHKTGENLVIFSDTRPEWLITGLASLKFGFPVTTVYATLGDEAIAHAINQSEAETVVTSMDLVAKLVVCTTRSVNAVEKADIFFYFKNLLPHCHHLKCLVYFHSIVPGVEKSNWKESTWPAGFKVISFEEVEKLGKMKRRLIARSAAVVVSQFFTLLYAQLLTLCSFGARKRPAAGRLGLHYVH